MTDLIKRLRERAARKWTDEANRSASLFGEAADEIERLTAENDATRATATTSRASLPKSSENEAMTIYIASNMRNPESRPRFVVQDGGLSIDDDDFIFDAQLLITGDFLEEDRMAYAQWIADALNAADTRLPR